jgi:hypothetical protein
MSLWSFQNVPFVWLRTSAAGHPAVPRWNRQPRIVRRPLLGSGNADVSSNGFLPWEIQGDIWVTDTDAAAFTALNGTLGTITDGTTIWTAVLTLDLATLAPDGAGLAGRATFVRPRA